MYKSIQMIYNNYTDDIQLIYCNLKERDMNLLDFINVFPDFN